MAGELPVSNVPSAVPIWSLKLRHSIRTGLVTIGKYDGRRPSLTCATEGGKVFVHDMTARQNRMSGIADSGQEYRLLDMQARVTSLLATNMSSPAAPGSEPAASARDCLFVGSDAFMKAYNVHDNSELFYKEHLHGVNCMTIGVAGDHAEPLVYSGGNCSVTGVDMDGNDQYWTVTGDNVQAIALVDYNLDGVSELLVGSDDYDIRFFKGEDMVAEISEADAILDICPLQQHSFAFSLDNGSVGVYEGLRRMWRIKSRNVPTSLLAYDYNLDGEVEVVSGWSKGKIDVRHHRTGDLLMRTMLPAGIAGIVQGDYTMEGTNSLLCCCVDGSVKCFNAPGSNPLKTTAQMNNEQEFEVQTLRQARKALLDQLSAENDNIKAMPNLKTNMGAHGIIQMDGTKMMTIHVDTKVECSIGLQERPDGESHLRLEVDLVGSKLGNTLIKSVVLFAEGLFENESHQIYLPREVMSKSVHVPMTPSKDISMDIQIRVMVGTMFSEQFHMFELRKVLPMFSFLVPQSVEDDEVPLTASGMMFQMPMLVPGDLSRWLGEDFFMTAEYWKDPHIKHIRVRSLRHRGRTLTLEVHHQAMVYVFTEDIELAGDVLQSFSQFLHAKDVNTQSYFPTYEEYIVALAKKVNEQDKAFSRLRAELADHSNLIRGLVVRAEDSRINRDMTGVRHTYKSLYEFNLDLVHGHVIRMTTHDQLTELQRQLNHALQVYGRLKLGKYKGEVITEAKKCLDGNNHSRLVSILRGYLDPDDWQAKLAQRKALRTTREFHTKYMGYN
ncbi:Bardet-Biedl syndrome 2 protein homolog [Sycon ciliatum]|uniref:Bardet-Biedl syndrome 2 protein homolog n=1 Tax=Sycon ciliatum TaxID=27933 RepID=UPI0031F613DA